MGTAGLESCADELHTMCVHVHLGYLTNRSCQVQDLLVVRMGSSEALNPGDAASTRKVSTGQTGLDDGLAVVHHVSSLKGRQNR